MSNVTDLHNEAMRLAELAMVQRLQRNPDGEADYTRQALEFELAAIEKLTDPVEPTFSVLHRSAGTLAFRCGKIRLAEQIVAKALAQEPPDEIAEELRDLLEQVHFQRHLDLRGVELGADEVQMSLSGDDVGYGLVTSNEMVSRIGHATTLIGRIVDRQRSAPFNEAGVRKITRESFPVLVSMPRAASFAVTLKVGRPTGQLHLAPELEVIVDEFMDVMETVSNADMQTLDKRIPEPVYLRNFVGLAKRIAPDGDRVRQVGFTVTRHSGERRVSLTRPAAEIPMPNVVESATGDTRPGKSVEVVGTLLLADATAKESNTIKIVQDSGRGRNVTVLPGMMNDIVRPMWNERVVVKGSQKGRTISLLGIELAK